MAEPFASNRRIRLPDTPGDNVSVADGSLNPVSIILDDDSTERSWRGRVRWRGDVSLPYSQANAATWAHYPDFDRAPDEAPWLWQTLLAHHAPPIPFRYENGTVEELPDAAVIRHRSCAHEIVSDAYDRAIAAADNPNRAETIRQQKQSYEVRAPHAVQEVRSLLSIMTAPLRPVAASESSAHVESMDQLQPGRAGEIRAHGRAFLFSMDFLARLQGAAPSVCTGWQIDDFAERIRDQCTISGFVDVRDGWPMLAVVTRVIERGDGSHYSAHMFLWRLQGSVSVPIPPNLCS